jgi:hypothetical protein
MKAIAMVLGARLLLLIAIIGAIFLAWMASNGDRNRLIALAIYAVFVFIPSIWLAGRK